MRFLIALAVFVLAGLQGRAGAQTWYWCEPARSYYPYVERCPVPWQFVNPSSAASRPDTATQAPLSTGQPTPPGQTAAPRFPLFGDALDDWCKTVQLPSSIAICSDGELRALTLERQHAFDEAKARLNTEQQKGLLADQNSWVKSYAAACGLSQDFAPSLPLAPSVKECMTQAGRARTAYLREYSPTLSASGQALPQSEQAQALPAGAASAQAPIGPSFGCGKALEPLATLICASPALSKLDLEFVQAYQALRQQVGAEGQQRLRQEALDFQQEVLQACGVPKAGPVSGSPDCVAAQYDRQRSIWLSRLRGSADEEAVRPIEQQIALQAQLQKLGFLPPTQAIDGVYGQTTRAAIVAWQRANGRPETGLIGVGDATALRASPALSAPQPQSTAENVAPGKSTKTLTKTQPIGTASPTKIEESPGNSPVPSSSHTSSPNPRNSVSSSANSETINGNNMWVLYIAIAVVGSALLGFIIWRKRAREKHQKFISDRVHKETYDTVSEHMRALVRKRFQTLRHDDYGNLLREPWEKEITYFMETVLSPRVQQLGYEEYAFYVTMQLVLRLTIDEWVKQQTGASESLTLGPNLTPTDYEQYCAGQLRLAGWSADTTKASGDQGTDIVAQKGDLRLVVQCKLYSHPVGNKAVQEIAAARAHERADYAAVVSNSRYTPSAQQLAKTNGVLLLHHTDLRNIDDLLDTIDTALA